MVSTALPMSFRVALDTGGGRRGQVVFFQRRGQALQSSLAETVVLIEDGDILQAQRRPTWVPMASASSA